MQLQRFCLFLGIRATTITLLLLAATSSSAKQPQVRVVLSEFPKSSLASSALKEQEAETSDNIDSQKALALHLQEIGAKMYGAYWCPYCKQQKQLFGKAFDEINYIECDPKGDNPQPELCRSAGITGFPTWEIKDQLYPGLHSLEELADLSEYQGDRNF
ncbi:MAG: hypothetical protein F6K36_24790 [Symploca sp. SIO3C6]|uniref:Thioredoxin domain-containing protein n=1 Tax=Symploca sp. SIO1C4 TaxID=2607765 RepID=A0A6B3N9Q3_9CYAN|nr:hypothetical protein [Symploca sp. SIO3C6]NER28397.1 hypothetical protein [Symploca sp. SIO1C4]NET04732.1 hypothetical protein [Symploca sp. SIO2B6]